MQVKILGPGCKRCKTLEARTREALRDLGVTAEISDIADSGEIAGYGVMRTPALVVDEEVVVSGRVPTVRELHDLLAACAGTPPAGPAGAAAGARAPARRYSTVLPASFQAVMPPSRCATFE